MKNTTTMNTNNTYAIFNGISFMACTAIHKTAGYTEREPAILIHDLADKFRNGDMLVWDEDFPETAEDARNLIISVIWDNARSSTYSDDFATKLLPGDEREIITEEDLEAEITDYLESLDYHDLIPLWNEYCENNNDADSMIYSMDEFDAILEGCSPSEIAEMIRYGNYRDTAGYFTFNGYGNIVSVDADNWDSEIFISDMVRHIVRELDDLNDGEIEYMITEYEIANAVADEVANEMANAQ